MTHELKTYPQYFKDVIAGKKTFEIRKNDRPFKEGDLLALNEFDGQAYTGNSCIVYIDYIMTDPDYCKKDMVIMSIKPCSVYRHTKPFNPNVLHSDYKVSLATKEDAERNGGND